MTIFIQSYGLTVKEDKVLDCLLAGESNKQIAEKLFTSEKTVKNHLTRIYEKLGVKTRLQAVVKAVQIKATEQAETNSMASVAN